MAGCSGPHGRLLRFVSQIRRALDSMFGRIFYGEPEATSPENALQDQADAGD